MLKKVSVLLLCLLWLTACGSVEHANESVRDSSSKQEAPQEASNNNKDMGYSGSQQDAAEKVKRKIIKQASLTQKVTELDPAVAKIHVMIDQSGGYIESSSISEYNETARHASFILRVPQASFLSMLDSLQAIGKNTRIAQKGEDVTLQYYDNEARIENLQKQEEAVRKLLDQAQKMEDIIKIQQELFRLRGEIEALQGKNRHLDNLASLSTIELTIMEVKPSEMSTDSTWHTAQAGFTQSLNDVVDLFKHLFIWFVSNLPLLLFVYFPIGVGLWLFIRRRLRDKQK
jgi:hypothetical protein